jgi:holo-[acyl-carrier protein] synthase
MSQKMINMPVKGIGTDLVFKPRIATLMGRFPQRFAAKILSAEEMVLWQKAANPADFLARQFAAKEAILKALGTGLRQGLAWHNMVVLRDTLGKPTVRLQGGALALVPANYMCHVSLADDGDYALAFAVIAC